MAVDLRGFGDSEKPVGVSQYKIKYLLNDIKNLVEALGRCHLFGVPKRSHKIQDFEYILVNT